MERMESSSLAVQYAQADVNMRVSNSIAIGDDSSAFDCAFVQPYIFISLEVRHE